MQELCGLDCCSKCAMRGTRCDGCAATDGHPCGGSCTAAECIKKGGREALARQKKAIMEELNALSIPGLQLTGLNLLLGAYVNMEYPLPNGTAVRLLRDDKVYWGTQIEKPGGDRCYGVAADESTLLVCEYGQDGADPQIILFKKR